MRKVEHTSEFPLTFIDEHWKTQKIKLLKKLKKMLEISSFYTCVPKTIIIWGTVPEIWSVTEFFLSFWAIFCPLNPLNSNNAENQNFEKMKKASGEIIILNLCNKKHNHMMYAYSNMECDRHNFLSFQVIFCSLATLWPWKLKFGKNVKNSWRYYPFTNVYH